MILTTYESHDLETRGGGGSGGSGGGCTDLADANKNLFRDVGLLMEIPPDGRCGHHAIGGALREYLEFNKEAVPEELMSNIHQTRRRE